MIRLFVIMVVVRSVFGAIVPDTQLKATLLEDVARYAPAGVQLRLDRIHVSAPMPGTAQLAWLEPKPPLGAVQFEYRWQDVEGVKRVIGNAEVSGFATIAVARRAIRHGESLTQDNLRFEIRRINPLMRSGFFQGLSELKDLCANGWIRNGDVIDMKHTRLPVLVEAGQVVEMSHERGNVRFVAQVKSRQGGRKNDWVVVENVNSGKTLKAQVMDKGRVWIP